MKNKLLMAACMALPLLSGPAMAATGEAKTGFYGQVDTGASFNLKGDTKIGPQKGFDISYDKSALISGAAGYDFGAFRADIELGYTKMDMDKLSLANTKAKVDGDVSSLTFMANGYWDISTATKWTPFVGGGLGLAHVDSSTPSDGDLAVNDKATVFAYQISAGTSYALTDTLSLVGAYRYSGTADASLKATSTTLAGVDKVKTDLSSHQLRIGARYTF